jgi:hypothetical protein
MSLGVAFVLVVPARVRATTAVFAVAYACLIGTGTVTAGWHRPSDVMGGFLVVAIWAALSTAGLIRWRGATAERESQHFGEPVVSPALAWAGAVLLALGFAGFVIVYLAIRQDRLDAVRLDGAYAASLVAIVGVAFVMVAAFLAALRGVGLDAPAPEPVRSGGAPRGTAPRAR